MESWWSWKVQIISQLLVRLPGGQIPHKEGLAKNVEMGISFFIFAAVHFLWTTRLFQQTLQIFDVSVVSNEEDLVLSRWKAKYEKQRSVVEQLHKEHEETLQYLGCVD